MTHSRLLLLLSLLACGERDSRTPVDTLNESDEPGLGADSLRIRHERKVDMAGDGRAERFVVEAVGHRYDSLVVLLEIRSPEDSVMFVTEWESFHYFLHEPSTAPADSLIERNVRDQIARLLADESFGTGLQNVVEDGDVRREQMREAIRYDIAEHVWREQHRLPLDAALPTVAHHEMRRIRVPTERIEALSQELQTRPSFQYFAGGEATYVIAWSQEEQRFVTIFACC